MEDSPVVKPSLKNPFAREVAPEFSVPGQIATEPGEYEKAG